MSARTVVLVLYCCVSLCFHRCCLTLTHPPMTDPTVVPARG